jgi:hypothetical protein
LGLYGISFCEGRIVYCTEISEKLSCRLNIDITKDNLLLKIVMDYL